MRSVRRRIASAALASAVASLSSVASARIGPTLRELVEVADIETLATSPDGREIAFRLQRPSVVANSYRIDWYVAEISSGRVRRVADGGAPIYTNGQIENEAPVWAPDSRSFVRRALVDQKIGLWRTAADGSGSRLVVGGPADVESLVADLGGKTFSYVTGPTRAEIEDGERKEYDEGVLIDPSIDTLQNLYRGGWEHGRLASERLTGRWYARAGLLWRASRVRHRVDLATMRELGSGAVPVQAPGALTQSYTAPPLTARAASGALVTVVGTADKQYLEARDAQGAIVACRIGPCSDRISWIGWQSDDVLFARRDDHFRQTLYLWNPRSGRLRRLAGDDRQLSGGRSGSEPCAITKSFVVCVEAGSVSPPRLVRIALVDGRETSLFDPNTDLRRQTRPLVEQLAYRLGDGREATGTLLYRPGPLPAKAPLFVTYYSCAGYLRGGTGDPFPLEPLVDSGFIVACLNIVPFAAWGEGPDRDRDALASVSALVALLDRRGWIDPARVGMGGFSMGSEAAMWVAMNSKLLAAAAVVSAQYEPTDYWMEAMRGSHIPQELREFQQAGPPDQDPERWKTISPALNTERIKAPLLMQMSEQEFRGGIELFSRLSNTTTPVEMYAFPDEAHIKIQPRHQYAIYRRNLGWFRYWLQGHVDPDSALAPQYQRWALLRRRQQGSAE
ncbi:MAG: Atxe2 family lasso peptide isopeptidase [Pseudomonadota bacterium]